MGWGITPALSLVPSTFDPSYLFITSSSSLPPFHSFLCNSSSSAAAASSNIVGSGPSSYTTPSRRIRFRHSYFYPSPTKKSELLFTKQICRAAEYQFPDPILEFAEAETEKFRTHLLKRLSKKDLYGDSVEEVVGICSEIFSTFLHTEYGGPGTLLVVPFIDMADTLNEQGLPGGPQAARAAVKWAQDHVDKDWNEWNGGDL